MKNNRNLFLQSALAVALASTFGAAHASSIGISAPAAAVAAYAGGYTIAAESTATAYNVNLDAAVATVNEGVLADRALLGTIRWVPTFGLNTGDVCTFTFANAVVTSADFKLLGEEAATQQPGIVAAGGVTDFNNDAAITGVVEVASNFGTLDTVNGVAAVLARINNGLNLPTGINLVLSETAGVNLVVDGVLDDTTNNLMLRIPAATAAGSQVTVTSSCVTSGGLAIGAATATNAIIDLETQFAVTLATAATSVADVGAATPRFNFVDEGANVLVSTNDSELTTSAALYTVNNDSNSSVEDFITLVGGDTLTVTLTSSTDLGAISTTAGTSYVQQMATSSGTVNDLANAAFTLATPNLTSAAIAGTRLPIRGATTSDDIVITVGGTAVITNRTFTGSAALNFLSAQHTDQIYSLGTTHTWTTNGTVLQSPFFSNSAGYISRFALTNVGTTDAPYTSRCLAETANVATLNTTALGGNGTDNSTGIIPAGGQVVLTSTDVCTFSGLTRGAIEFTVAGPVANIHGTYNVTSPTGGVTLSNMQGATFSQ